MKAARVPGVAGLGLRASTLAVLAIIVAACVGASPSPVGPSPSPVGPSPSPVVAEANKGPFKLQLALPRADWHATDTINGEATLSLVGVETLKFGTTASGPIIFSFAEVGGSRSVEGIHSLDCKQSTLEAGKPLVVPITKQGAYDPAAPSSDFHKWFMTGPHLQLPAGTWRITAVAYVNTDDICPDESHALRVSVELHVTP